MTPDLRFLQVLEDGLTRGLRVRLEEAVRCIVSAKQRGQKVAVFTGNGLNVHEGVTTLLAELMRVGLVDAVATSSSVVAHEMAGTLGRVKRCVLPDADVPGQWLAKAGEFELSLLEPSVLSEIARDMPIDADLMRRLQAAPGEIEIKPAGDLAYPLGLWLERFAWDILVLARSAGKPFEEVAGLGADPRTIIGMGAQRQIPVLVTIPQLVGGGAVGLAIAESICTLERANRVARILAEAQVIIESGGAWSQELYDGPFETSSGHGLWAGWLGQFTFSLRGKNLIRIDFDPALERLWELERGNGAASPATNGLHKSKLQQAAIRPEMARFARHSPSLPLVGDLGAIWPLLAWKCADALKLDLQFLSYPQHSGPGQAMRDAIVNSVRPVSRARLQSSLHSRPALSVTGGRALGSFQGADRDGKNGDAGLGTDLLRSTGTGTENGAV